MKTAEVIGRQIACDGGRVTALSRCMHGRKILSTFAVLLFWSASAFGDDWKIIRQRDRDYVTFANVAQFYQFPEYTRVSRTVSLRSDRRGIRAQAGTSEFYINGVRFFADFPLLSSGDDDMISVMDVSKIIEPVLRPSRIQNAKESGYGRARSGPWGNRSGRGQQWGTEKGFALDVALVGQRAA